MVQAVEGPRVKEVPHTATMTADQYAEAWPFIEEQLDRVPHLWQNYWTKVYLRNIYLHQELVAFQAGVNGAMNLVIFAQFRQTPRGKGLCFVLALGNSLDKVIDQMQGTFELLAQQTECDYVEISGREGWLRKLPGFKKDYTVMSKQLQRFRVN